MNSLVRKFLCSVLSVALFVTNSLFAYATETSLWSERDSHRNNNGASVLQVAALPPIVPPLHTSVIPQRASLTGPNLNSLLAFGTLRDAVPARTSGQRRLVVHIQDVHMNAEAQANIGRAVGALIDGKTAGLIALEGAFAPINLAPLRDRRSRRAVQRVADFLLRENTISGPIHAGLTATALPPPIVGIDDETHYNANVAAVRAAAPAKKISKERLDDAKRRLLEKKKSTFSAALAAFDARVESYRAGALPFGAYVRALRERAPRVPDVARRFMTALDMESSLRVPDVERERSALVTALAARLNATERDELVSASAAFRAGTVHHADFYDYLRGLCDAHGVGLEKFPAMAFYLRYVTLADSLDAAQLNEAVCSMEREAYDALARTEEEKIIVAASRQIYLTGKLVELALTRDEWEEYWERKSDLDLKPFESFYNEASARDDAMAENLLREINARNSNLTVLVTGGFHSSGIARRLADAGVATVAFVPKISKVDVDGASAYLSVFTQEKTPLEKLFQGEKLFLAKPVMPAGAVGETNLLETVEAFGDGELTEAAAGRAIEGDLGWKSVSLTVHGDHTNVSGRHAEGENAVETILDVSHDPNGGIRSVTLLHAALALTVTAVAAYTLNARFAAPWPSALLIPLIIALIVWQGPKNWPFTVSAVSLGRGFSLPVLVWREPEAVPSEALMTRSRRPYKFDSGHRYEPLEGTAVDRWLADKGDSALKKFGAKNRPLVEAELRAFLARITAHDAFFGELFLYGVQPALEASVDVAAVRENLAALEAYCVRMAALKTGNRRIDPFLPLIFYRDRFKGRAREKKNFATHMKLLADAQEATPDLNWRSVEARDVGLAAGDTSPKTGDEDQKKPSKGSKSPNSAPLRYTFRRNLPPAAPMALLFGAVQDQAQTGDAGWTDTAITIVWVAAAVIVVSLIAVAVRRAHRKGVEFAKEYERLCLQMLREKASRRAGRKLTEGDFDAIDLSLFQRGMKFRHSIFALLTFGKVYYRFKKKTLAEVEAAAAQRALPRPPSPWPGRARAVRKFFAPAPVALWPTWLRDVVLTPITRGSVFPISSRIKDHYEEKLGWLPMSEEAKAYVRATLAYENVRIAETDFRGRGTPVALPALAPTKITFDAPYEILTLDQSLAWIENHKLQPVRNFFFRLELTQDAKERHDPNLVEPSYQWWDAQMIREGKALILLINPGTPGETAFITNLPPTDGKQETALAYDPERLLTKGTYLRHRVPRAPPVQGINETDEIDVASIKDGFVDELRGTLTPASATPFESAEDGGKAFANLLNRSLTTLLEITKSSRALRTYTRGLLENAGNARIEIHVNAKLPTTAARSTNPQSGSPMIIFQESFLHALLATRYRKAAEIMIAERLFHELGHIDSEEERDLIRMDIRLHLRIVSERTGEPWQRFVDNFFAAAAPKFQSNNYFSGLMTRLTRHLRNPTLLMFLIDLHLAYARIPFSSSSEKRASAEAETWWGQMDFPVAADLQKAFSDLWSRRGRSPERMPFGNARYVPDEKTSKKIKKAPETYKYPLVKDETKDEWDQLKRGILSFIVEKTKAERERRNDQFLGRDLEILIGRGINSPISPSRKLFLAYLLTLANLGLVRMVAGQTGPELSADTFAEGLHIILRKAHKYDPMKNFKKTGEAIQFGTYITFWLKQRRQEVQADNRGAVHVPQNVTRRGPYIEGQLLRYAYDHGPLPDRLSYLEKARIANDQLLREELGVSLTDEAINHITEEGAFVFALPPEIISFVVSQISRPRKSVKSATVLPDLLVLRTDAKSKRPIKLNENANEELAALLKASLVKVGFKEELINSIEVVPAPRGTFRVQLRLANSSMPFIVTHIMTSEYVGIAMENAVVPFSIDKSLPPANGKKEARIDIEDHAKGPEDTEADSERGETRREALRDLFASAKLSPRDILIIEMKFGLNGKPKAANNEEIGRLLKVTKERVRQLFNRSMRKLAARAQETGTNAIEAVRLLLPSKKAGDKKARKKNPADDAGSPKQNGNVSILGETTLLVLLAAPAVVGFVFALAKAVESLPLSYLAVIGTGIFGFVVSFLKFSVAAGNIAPGPDDSIVGLRQMTPEDFPALKKIEESANHSLVPSWDEQAFLSYRVRYDHIVLVAVDAHNNAVGYIAYHAHSARAVIERWRISPVDSTKRLLELFVSRLSAENKTADVELRLDPRDSHTADLIKTLGFEPAGGVIPAWHRPVDRHDEDSLRSRLTNPHPKTDEFIEIEQATKKEMAIIHSVNRSIDASLGTRRKPTEAARFSEKDPKKIVVLRMTGRIGGFVATEIENQTLVLTSLTMRTMYADQMTGDRFLLGLKIFAAKNKAARVTVFPSATTGGLEQLLERNGFHRNAPEGPWEFTLSEPFLQRTYFYWMLEFLNSQWWLVHEKDLFDFAGGDVPNVTAIYQWNDTEFLGKRDLLEEVLRKKIITERKMEILRERDFEGNEDILYHLARLLKIEAYVKQLVNEAVGPKDNPHHPPGLFFIPGGLLGSSAADATPPHWLIAGALVIAGLYVAFRIAAWLCARYARSDAGRDINVNLNGTPIVLGVDGVKTIRRTNFIDAVLANLRQKRDVVIPVDNVTDEILDDATIAELARLAPKENGGRIFAVAQNAEIAKSLKAKTPWAVETESTVFARGWKNPFGIDVAALIPVLARARGVNAANAGRDVCLVVPDGYDLIAPDNTLALLKIAVLILAKSKLETVTVEIENALQGRQAAGQST